MPWIPQSVRIVYLDDIIIYSQNWEEHIWHINLVLERLTVHNFTCAMEKCFFARKEVKYLGHLVTQDCNQAQEEHIQAIVIVQTPRNRHELQKFLRVCRWVSEYVPNYSEISAPLTDLLKRVRPGRHGPTRLKWPFSN